MIELFTNNKLERKRKIAVFTLNCHPFGFYIVYCSVLVQQDALECTAV
jgi:hypothetical protein